MHQLYIEVAEVVARGERAALVTVVRTNGSTPQRVGAKMLVHADGRTTGTIGGGCYESDACQKARVALGDGRPQLVRYDLNDSFAEESGLVCGGQMDVFIEPIVPPPTLYVLGAGHVGAQVVTLAAGVGFQVHVVDDREKFANADRCPQATSVVVAPIADWVAETRLPPDAYVVVVTRGHRYDLDAIRALCGRPLRYVGLIGSRAKVARIFEQLAAQGAPAEWLKQVQAPIGLDIGAVTPEEIAVSIVAELIAARYGRLVQAAEGDIGVRSLRWTPALSQP